MDSHRKEPVIDTYDIPTLGDTLEALRHLTASNVLADDEAKGWVFPDPDAPTTLLDVAALDILAGVGLLTVGEGGQLEFAGDGEVIVPRCNRANLGAASATELADELRSRVLLDDPDTLAVAIMTAVHHVSEEGIPLDDHVPGMLEHERARAARAEEGEALAAAIVALDELLAEAELAEDTERA